MRTAPPRNPGVRRVLLSAAVVALAVCGILAVEGNASHEARAAATGDRVSATVTATHDTAIGAPAARVTRPHRINAASAFLAAALVTTLALCAQLRARSRVTSRSGEPFFVRRRGPPLHLTAA